VRLRKGNAFHLKRLSKLRLDGPSNSRFSIYWWNAKNSKHTPTAIFEVEMESKPEVISLVELEELEIEDEDELPDWIVLLAGPDRIRELIFQHS